MFGIKDRNLRITLVEIEVESSTSRNLAIALVLWLCGILVYKDVMYIVTKKATFGE